MLPDAIVKSEINAAGGVVPVHRAVTGGLQSTAVEPPVPVVAAPPVSVPVAAPPVGALTEPPVVTVAAPPVGFAPPPAEAFVPPVELGLPPTVAPVPPPLLVAPPDVVLVLPPLLGGLVFDVDEPQPITNVAITSDSNPILEINEARRVVMAKTPFFADHPASNIPIVCGKLFISGTFKNSRHPRAFLYQGPLETGIDAAPCRFVATRLVPHRGRKTAHSRPGAVRPEPAGPGQAYRCGRRPLARATPTSLTRSHTWEPRPPDSPRDEKKQIGRLEIWGSKFVRKQSSKTRASAIEFAGLIPAAQTNPHSGGHFHCGLPEESDPEFVGMRHVSHLDDWR